MVDPSGIEVSYEKVANVPDFGGRPARLQEIDTIPGSPLLTALDTGGAIWAVDPDGGPASLIVNLRQAGAGFIDNGNEAGLRSLAFHPDFATPGSPGYGKLYLGYSATVESRPDGVRLYDIPAAATFHEVVAEFTVADPAAPVVDPATKRELYRVEHSATNHNIGTLAFNTEARPGDPDYGLLYITHGDGGGGYDIFDLAQVPSHPFGSMLRIAPTGGRDGAPYDVPADNPDIPGALPETYAYGLRNGQHFEFSDGRIWLSDIGQGSREEVNIILPGGNYGWVEREGTLAVANNQTQPLPQGDAALGYQYPIAELDHNLRGNGGFAIAGGYVYDGADVPDLGGQYLFSIFSDGRVYTIDADDLGGVLADGRIAPGEQRDPGRLQLVDFDGEPLAFADTVASASGRADLRFAEDANGEILFFGKHRGEILRIIEAPEVVELDGPARAYTLRLDADEDTLVIDAKEGSETVYDGLDTVDLIEFGDGFSFVAETRFDLRKLTGAAELDAAELATLTELYIAYFDRAPDALGLLFWADALSQGVALEAIARAFLDQPEYAANYPDTLDNGDFVEAVYGNVLGRAPDDPGLAFWEKTLDSGDVTRDVFILRFLEGANGSPPTDPDLAAQQQADQAYLAAKVEIGTYYAITRGLSDTQDAEAAMSLFDGSGASLATARERVDTDYADALDPGTGDLLVSLVGVADDPFA